MQKGNKTNHNIYNFAYISPLKKDLSQPRANLIRYCNTRPKNHNVIITTRVNIKTTTAKKK